MKQDILSSISYLSYVEKTRQIPTQCAFINYNTWNTIYELRHILFQLVIEIRAHA